ncbi:MAG: hypothetical protein P1V20_01500 [Verrucomicrobiales bacterium]|nr:hypothetical protein [Verrucomicrobiales bacterium]
MTDHINTLVFVFTHSAFLWPFALVFTALGFWQGYVFWAKWEDELQFAMRERSDLKNKIARLQRETRLGIATGVDAEFSYTPPTWISIFKGEFDQVEIDAELGVIYPVRPSIADDLTALSGVDKERARKLNEAGIYTYKQLAGLDQKQRDHFRSRFGDISWNELMTIVAGPDYTHSAAA